MKRLRLQWQIYLPVVGAILVALIVLLAYMAFRIREFDRRAVQHELLSQAWVIEGRLSPLLEAGKYNKINLLIRSFKGRLDTRFTVILPSGKVVADSRHDPKTMENHADRPEVIEALSTGQGHSARFSFTLKQNMMYTAVPIHAKNRTVIGIIRTSRALSRVNAQITHLYTNILFAGLVFILLIGWFSFMIASRITRPLHEIRKQAQRLADGDFSVRVPVFDTPELDVFARTMNEMSDQIREKVRQIEAQKHLIEAAFSGMREGVMVINKTGDIVNFNRPMAIMLDIGGKKGKVFENIRNPQLMKLLNLALDTGKDQETEITIDRDYGKRIIQAYTRPIYDYDKNVSGAVMVLSDMTDLRKLETVRKDFVANVSHELRTPITAIRGFVETIMSGRVNNKETLQQFLSIISRHTARMNAIIEDLLTLSRVEASAGRVEKRRQPLYSVLDEALSDHMDEASKKRITINIDCAQDLEAAFNFNLMEQAVANLVGNAVRYSPEDTVVTVSARKEKDNIVISVTDHGPGIPRQHLPRLFERFYRVDRARSRKQGSTGLGLAIVRHIAIVHNGSVSVSSTPGKGSKFDIILPV